MLLAALPDTRPKHAEPRARIILWGRYQVPLRLFNRE